MRRSTLSLFATLLIVAGSVACHNPEPPASTGVELLPRSEQIRVREQWLAIRHGMLLEMMREHGIEMWIVASEEFHDDPLAQLVGLPRPNPSNRLFLVFIDQGEAGLRKVLVARFSDEAAGRFFEIPEPPVPPNELLAQLYEEHHPATIGLSMGGRRGMTRSLTHDTYLYLAETLGSEAESRFVSAAALIEQVLNTRIPEELEHFRTAVQLTEQLSKRAFSSEVIEPGCTTVGDVRDWLYDQLGEYGVDTWFQPDIRVQRHGMENPMWHQFLGVSPEALVIEAGDLLHMDLGIIYMGLHTDWQKMAYVLRPGEQEPPAGLSAGLAEANALQDAVQAAARPGRPVAEVYDEAMAAMESAGIRAQIYSHSLGNHGHGAGPGIDFRAAQRRKEQIEHGDTEPVKVLQLGSYMSLELGTQAEVADWDGQLVFYMLEDPIVFTEQSFDYVVPRQESFYLVR